MKIIILITLLSVSICKAQKFDWKSREIKSDTDLLKTTVWLRASNGSNGGTGTGYFFYSTQKNKLFLITNKHVVEPFVNLVFSLKKDLNDSGQFGIDSLHQRYLTFDNDTDLVAIRIDNLPNLNLSEFPYFRVFTEKNIISEKQIKDLNLFDENIIALSYAGLSMVGSNGIPLIIKCNFASSYAFDLNNIPEFYINGTLTQGCSGSPIILIKKNEVNKQYLLLGTYYFSLTSLQTISKVKNDTLKNWSYKPIYKSEIGQIDSIAYWHDYGVGKAIKSKILIDLFNQ